MNTKQIELVRKSWTMVSSLDSVVVGNLFYNRLFEVAPDVKHMFRTPIAEQSRKLLAMLAYIISKLDKLDEIKDEVSKLAVRHVHYGVKEIHYRSVGSALLWTLEKGLGENWNDELKEAWTSCYIMLSNAMIQAAEAEREAA